MRQTERPHFDSVIAYAKRFTDADYWRPHVETICARHGLTPCRNIRAGLPGTHPVFIVDDHFIVKLFTNLFNGADSYAVEVDLYALLAAIPEIPAPKLLARGQLFPDDGGWRWPYLVGTAIRGLSFGEARDRVTLADQLALAAYLGSIVRTIHALPVEQVPSLTRSWGGFLHLLHIRRAACADDYARAGTMPGRLRDQLERYLPPIEAVVDRSLQPQLLHCDLNGDHVLGTFERGHWRPTGIIDFGDARVGDPLYDLVALHLGLFRGNKQCLRAFIDSYGSRELLQERFVGRAMAMTLLHEFTVLDPIFELYPQAREVADLADLADLLWNMEQPGLVDGEA